MYRGPIAWMAGHSVTANLLMLVFLVGGVIWGSRIKQEVFPDFELDVEGEGWQKLQEAFKIRNRITHPKKRQYLIVTRHLSKITPMVKGNSRSVPQIH